VDDWKSALTTLPDNVYFELMRSVFGSIKTPFSKHRLMEDLAAFLSRKNIQETIAAYIDERDARIIAAVAVLYEPVPGELESFFAGEFTYADIQGILLNLEERLILYRFMDGVQRRLALNPLLEPVLAPVIAGWGVLFPPVPAASVPAASGTAEAVPGKAAEKTAPPGPEVDDRLFAALFAFAGDAGEFYKAEGGIRKKVLDDGARIFPGLRLDLHVGAMQCLELLRLDGDRLEPNEGKLIFFNDLTFQGRLEYYAAGMGIYLIYSRSALVYFQRGRIQILVRLIHGLTGSLERNRLYPALTLRRLAFILLREEDGGLKEGSDESLVFESVMTALEETGLLRAAGSGLWIRPDIPDRERPALSGPDQAGGPAHTAAMDTAFSCILYPGIAFADAAALAFFCSARETGAVVRFELTRNSAVRGFNRGMDAASMLELLNRLTGGRIDGNLDWTLKDWESRYSGVALHEGIVMILAPERRYLAEAMAPLIARVLAPGVYLLSAAETSEAVKWLAKSGVDIVAQPPLRSGEIQNESRISPYPPPPGSGQVLDLSRGKSSPPDPGKAEQYREHFRLFLGKMQLSRAERDELSARIERRLVLTESQLAPASLRYEKLEARGLDYVGKTVIAKQAIASKLPVEVFWTGPQGEERVQGVPEALEKSDGETLLVIHPARMPAAWLPASWKPVEDLGREEAAILRIPMGKISLLRRIKQSIFGE
jgi:hypothetical protein